MSTTSVPTPATGRRGGGAAGPGRRATIWARPDPRPRPYRPSHPSLYSFTPARGHGKLLQRGCPHPDHGQETGNRHREAVAWNNLGTALRAAERHGQAVLAGIRATELLTQTNDLLRAGEAYGELADSLSAAGSEPTKVSEA